MTSKDDLLGCMLDQVHNAKTKAEVLPLPQPVRLLHVTYYGNSMEERQEQEVIPHLVILTVPVPFNLLLLGMVQLRHTVVI